MAVNKVEANGETLIDLTNDTVQASDVLKGKTLHLASGVQVEGTYDHDSKQDTFVDLWEAEVGSEGINNLDIDELSDLIDNYSALIVTISNESDDSDTVGNSCILASAYCHLSYEFRHGDAPVSVPISLLPSTEHSSIRNVLSWIFMDQTAHESTPRHIYVLATRDPAVSPSFLTGLYLRKIVGIPISGWKFAVLSGYMPLVFLSNGDNLSNYRIYGTADGAGTQTGKHSYTLPLTVTSGTESKNAVIPIGDTKLFAGDYVNYESGTIYKAKRIHEDTVTIDGIEWDILDYDHDEVYKADGTRAKHTVTIQTHDCIDELQYSAKQAAFAFPDGLATGTYHFTIGEHPWVAGDVGKVLTFTLENAIPAGGQLVFNGVFNRTLVDTTISAFASATDTTATETVTMTEGNTGTDLGTMLRSKTNTINSIDRALRGSNNSLKSAMRQYLNSDKTAGNVWTPQTVFDRPPEWATTTAGFLNGKSINFISHIGTAKKTTGLNNISDGGGTAVHDEKVFLLSRTEVFMGDEYAGGEGTPYAYYKNYSDNQVPSVGEDRNRIKYRAGNACVWWVRSPYVGYADVVGLIITSGAWNGYFAANVYGVAPACCIVLDDMDDWVKQTFYTEIAADLPAIETFKGENTLDSTETLGQVTITGKIKEA